MTKIHSILLALLFLSSLNAQLISPTDTASRILSPKEEFTPTILIGYGDHGVLVTSSGEYLKGDLLMHLESVELDIENPNEWTISWNSADGESYYLTYMENDFYTVGDGEVTNANWPQSACGGGPELTHEELVNDFLNHSLRNFVDYNDAVGGDAYYTGDEPNLDGPYFLASAIGGIQDSELDGRWNDISIMDTITAWDDIEEIIKNE